MENLPSTSLTYQMFRCSIMHTSLTTWIPRLALSKQCWDEEHFQDRVKCTGVHKLQHCLGERGKGGKIKADRVNCPKNFVLHCRSGFSHHRHRCRADWFVRASQLRFLATWWCSCHLCGTRFLVVQTVTQRLAGIGVGVSDSHFLS